MVIFRHLERRLLQQGLGTTLMLTCHLPVVGKLPVDLSSLDMILMLTCHPLEKAVPLHVEDDMTLMLTCLLQDKGSLP